MSQTPVPITGGSGTSSIAAELVAGISWQQVEIYGGGGASVLTVNPDGSFKASIIGTPTVSFSGSPSISGAVTIVGSSIPNGSVSGTVGASVIGTVPVTFANSSISGTVGASVIGAVPVTQSGAWTASIVGGPITLYAPSASLVSATTSIITTTSQTSVLATAPGAQRNYVTNILVTNAGVTGTQVNIMDGPNVVYAGYAAASGGGFALTFPAPFKQATLAQSLDVKAVTTTSITAAMSGFTAA